MEEKLVKITELDAMHLMAHLVDDDNPDGIKGAYCGCLEDFINEIQELVPKEYKKKVRFWC